MSQPLQEYEGTWEELAAHEPEFRGRKLRLTMLPERPPSISLQERRAFLKRPLAERRRILAEQAE